MGTINKIRKIAKQKVAKEIYEVYVENGMHTAIDYAEEYNSKHISQIPFEWCEPCDNNMPSRMGNNAQCPECGKNEWLLLAQEQVAVREGGKPYCECLNCGLMTHL